MGEHVIAYWYKGSKIKWCLGTIEKIKLEKLIISYMTRGDSKGQSWTFPESAELLETTVEQVIAVKVKVQYLGTVRIRCNLMSKTLASEMDILMDSIQSK